MNIKTTALIITAFLIFLTVMGYAGDLAADWVDTTFAQLKDPAA